MRKFYRSGKVFVILNKNKFNFCRKEEALTTAYLEKCI